MAKINGAVLETVAPPTARRRRTPEVEPETTGRVINGVAVVRETPVASNLPTGVPRRMTELAMADGSTLFGCADCPSVGQTRGEMMKHRQHEHTSGRSYPRSRKVEPVLPAHLAEITLAELMEAARTAADFGEAVARLEAERDEFRERAEVAERRLRKLTVALERAGFAPAVDD